MASLVRSQNWCIVQRPKYIEQGASWDWCFVLFVCCFCFGGLLIFFLLLLLFNNNNNSTSHKQAPITIQTPTPTIKTKPKTQQTQQQTQTTAGYGCVLASVYFGRCCFGTQVSLVLEDGAVAHCSCGCWVGAWALVCLFGIWHMHMHMHMKASKITRSSQQSLDLECQCAYTCTLDAHCT